MNRHYPWHFHKLGSWISLRLYLGESAENIADELRISPRVLQEWTVLPFPNLKLEHIHSIAHARGWSIDKTVQWLDVKPEHLEVLTEQAQNSKQYQEASLT